MSGTGKRIKKQPDKFSAWKEGDTHAPMSVRSQVTKKKKKQREKNQRFQKKKKEEIKKKESEEKKKKKSK